MTTPFAAAFAVGDIATLAQRCLAQLPSTGADATLGILYVSEPAAPALPQLVRDLAAGTGIASWVGGVRLGICGRGEGGYEPPAAAGNIATLTPAPIYLVAATGAPSAATPHQHPGRDKEAYAHRAA